MMDLSGEQLRHRYLEAIGIGSWLPRTQLPGAAPSPQWVERFRYPSADESEYVADHEEGGADPVAPESMPVRGSAPVAPRESGESIQNARSRARASIAPLIGAESAGSTESAAKAPTPAPAPAAETQSDEPAAPVRRGAPLPAPRVKLAFVLAGDLLIVDSLPPAARQGFSAQHRRLLAGVARALGVVEPPSDASLLSWPVLAGTSLDQGPDELTRAVRRKLELTLALRSVKRALLLGESAAQWLLEREESLDALRGIRFTLRPELPCVAGVSLSQALQLPELKAELWRDLQPLLPKPGLAKPE